jgi:hypothetical protein
MVSSWLLRRVALVSHLVFLRSVRRLLVAACVFPSSQIFVTLMKEVPGSSETSVLTRATRRNNPEDTILDVIIVLIFRRTRTQTSNWQDDNTKGNGTTRRSLVKGKGEEKKRDSRCIHFTRNLLLYFCSLRERRYIICLYRWYRLMHGLTKWRVRCGITLRARDSIERYITFLRISYIQAK